MSEQEPGLDPVEKAAKVLTDYCDDTEINEAARAVLAAIGYEELEKELSNWKEGYGNLEWAVGVMTTAAEKAEARCRELEVENEIKEAQVDTWKECADVVQGRLDKALDLIENLGNECKAGSEAQHDVEALLRENGRL